MKKKTLLALALAVLACGCLAWLLTRPKPHKVYAKEVSLLNEAYRIKQEKLRALYDRRVRESETSRESFSIQQEGVNRIEELRERFLHDKAAILRGDASVLRTHWAEEIQALKEEKYQPRPVK